MADVLLGQANPSGRLAETLPLRLEVNPSYLNFPGEEGHVRYGEGVFVGYRGYDAEAEVACQVTNTGDRRGKEVVQLYVGDPAASVARPLRELKGLRQGRPGRR